MDFPVIILVAFLCGVVKVLKTGDKAESLVAVQVDVPDEVVDMQLEIPVGNNLMLNREMNAFTAILLELGLKKQ